MRQEVYSEWNARWDAIRALEGRLGVSVRAARAMHDYALTYSRSYRRREVLFDLSMLGGMTRSWLAGQENTGKGTIAEIEALVGPLPA